MTLDWKLVAREAARIIEQGNPSPGQRDSLYWIAERLRSSNGIVLADEVGTGKTRIACAMVHAVVAAGGRVATVVPKGLLHQWVAESKQLDATLEPKVLTTLPELFRDANQAPPGQLVITARNQPWCAISHNFQAPQLQSQPWRAGLPTLVELALAPKARLDDGRKREGRLAQWLAGKDEKSVKRWAYWRGMRALARDVAPFVKADPALLQQIRKLPDISITQWGPHIDLDEFRSLGGEAITERLLGLWLGAFDLVVVDEAHKSRGEIEEESAKARTERAKVLVRLLQSVLVQTPDRRRLCLTATPMELDPTQWDGLLRRAHVDLEESGRGAIEAFKNATQEAAVAPDEVARIDSLCKASVAFRNTLRPYVTRRRRTEDGLLQEIIALGAGSQGPHPHRRIEPLHVSWTDPAVRASAWVDVLFAAEGLNHASKGLSSEHISNKAKLAYTKLCSGHVVDVGRIDCAEDVEPATRGKVARVNYWATQMREARDRISDSGDDALIESEHPRITLAVREIEGWTEGTSVHARKEGEKVLVFGVYVAPLETLRDVLNIRHVLRAADAGQPIAHAFNESVAIAVRQLERMRAEGQITGRLAIADAKEMRRAIDESHQVYKRLQARLSRVVKQITDEWFEGNRLPGIPADLRGKIRSHVLMFVLDHFLMESSADLSTRIDERERVEKLALEYYEDHIRGEIDDSADTDRDEDARETALRALFDEDAVTLQRRYAVLLDGNTGAPTRRYIQAAFNRRTSSPRVLIAQSQVGREGLNLHRSCRVVLQFHAEWNPGTLEQQIGRVDRMDSLWEELAREWLASDRTAPLPRIEVRQLVFEATYDAFQWERVGRRQHLFNASLFGTLIAEKTLDRVPEEKAAELAAAAPDFRPPRVDSPR